MRASILFPEGIFANEFIAGDFFLSFFLLNVTLSDFEHAT